jgi:putative transposase
LKHASKSWFSAKLSKPKDTSFKKNLPSLKKKFKPLFTKKDSDEDSDSDSEEEITKKSKKEVANTTITVRLEPTKEQKEILIGWLGTCRWVYNKAVDSKIESYDELCKRFANNPNYEDTVIKDEDGEVKRTILNENGWALKTPMALRQQALRDLDKSRKTNKKNVKSGLISRFDMKHRSKKDKQQSLVLLGQVYKKKGDGFTFYHTFFNKANVSPIIKARGDLPDKLHHDSRIVRTRLGEWYLKYPTTVSEADVLGDDSQVPSKRICSLDPGLRTFETIFDFNGAVIEVGANDRAKLFRLALSADDLISRRSSLKGRKRYTYRKAYLRIFRKITRLVDEIHHKLVKFLIMNYNVIYLPTFNTQEMIKKSTSKGLRKINSNSARMLTAWSHYKFKTRLLYKASLVSHCKVIICDESYTSKTCTCCGKLNDKLGGSKVFKCGSCKMEMDRDFNGARNILLKNLVNAKC